MSFNLGIASNFDKKNLVIKLHNLGSQWTVSIRGVNCSPNSVLRMTTKRKTSLNSEVKFDKNSLTRKLDILDIIPLDYQFDSIYKGQPNAIVSVFRLGNPIVLHWYHIRYNEVFNFWWKFHNLTASSGKRNF